MKKIFLILIVLVLIIGIFVFFYLPDILKVSTETILKQSLPPYITVKDVVFDVKQGVLSLKGLRINGPDGYRNRFLVEEGDLSCRYEMRGKSIFSGIEVKEILADGIKVNIERRADNRINVNDMGKLMRGTKQKGQEKAGKAEKTRTVTAKRKSRVNLADIISLPDIIKLRNGEVLFYDNKVKGGPYMLTFDEITSDLELGLNDDFTKVLRVASRGRGILNKDRSQEISWAVSLDPTQEGLTMSNRYEVKGLELKQFRPYYDKYSPIIVSEGTFSGTLVFDFDHGNIGSMNTLIIKGLKFKEKETSTGYDAWKGDVLPEIMRYLATAPDELTFDFKIKGSMENPEIYPGPRVKEAIEGMVVDKLAGAIMGLSGDDDAQKGGKKSDVEKVVDIMRDIF